MNTKLEPRQRTVWKVCRRVHGRYYSAMMDCPGLSLRYRKGVWTRPKLGRLLAFDTERDAKYFAGNRSDYRIFRAIGLGVTFMGTRSIPDFSCTQPVFRAYWEGKPWKELFFPPEMRAPEGTILCDAIKIL